MAQALPLLLRLALSAAPLKGVPGEPLKGGRRVSEPPREAQPLDHRRCRRCGPRLVVPSNGPMPETSEELGVGHGRPLLTGH